MGTADVTNVSVACVNQTGNGSPRTFSQCWKPGRQLDRHDHDGGLTISSQVVVGTNGAYSGDIRTGEIYASDQSSQIEVTSTQLGGGQWIGAGCEPKMAARASISVSTSGTAAIQS